jgi:hypothetical protein
LSKPRLTGPSLSQPVDPGFDMRIGYFQTLTKLFEVEGYAIVNDNFVQQINVIRAIMALVTPYIGDKYKDDILSSLKEASALNRRILLARMHHDSNITAQVMSDEETLREMIFDSILKRNTALARQKLLIPVREVTDEISDEYIAQEMGL